MILDVSVSCNLTLIHNAIYLINVDRIYYYDNFSNKNYVENYFGENLF